MSMVTPDFKKDFTKVSVIRRQDLPSIQNVIVGGVTYALGEHRNFRRSAYLSDFIPENARLAIAWVRLLPGEVLQPHVHPIESMIIICEGEGEFLGDSPQLLKSGDIVAVPRGVKHGFQGRGSAGFTALSIQFEESGLYNDPQRALVTFNNKSELIEKACL